MKHRIVAGLAFVLMATASQHVLVADQRGESVVRNRATSFSLGEGEQRSILVDLITR